MALDQLRIPFETLPHLDLHTGRASKCHISWQTAFIFCQKELVCGYFRLILILQNQRQSALGLGSLVYRSLTGTGFAAVFIDIMPAVRMRIHPYRAHVVVTGQG